MSATIEILSPDGVKLAEFGAGEFRLGTRSWCLTEAGDADFDVPRNNPKVRSDYLTLPNLVRIKSSTGVPGWYGPIAKVNWSDPEWMRVTCESAETLLGTCNIITTHDTHLTTGAYLKQCLQEAFDFGLYGVSIGAIDLGGPTCHFPSVAANLWDEILPDLRSRSWSQGFARNSNGAYQFWTEADGQMYWQPRRGVDRRRSLCLHVGAGGVGYATPNFEIDYRRVVTVGIGLGNASAADEKERRDYEDKDLSAKYRRRSRIIDADGNTSDIVLDAAKRGIHHPERALDVTIDNWADTWLKFWVGDLIRVSDPRSGYPDEGGMLYDCRVTGIEIQEEAERMRVIGKEWPKI